MVVEGLALSLAFHRRRVGIAPRRLVPNLAAGFCLMLAVRLALGRANDAVMAACLLMALVAHLVDLAGRWRDGRR